MTDDTNNNNLFTPSQSKVVEGLLLDSKLSFDDHQWKLKFTMTTEQCDIYRSSLFASGDKIIAQNP